jgi:hypothetical protein
MKKLQIIKYDLSKIIKIVFTPEVWQDELLGKQPNPEPGIKPYVKITFLF